MYNVYRYRRRRGERKMASIVSVWHEFDACIFGRFVFKIEYTSHQYWTHTHFVHINARAQQIEPNQTESKRELTISFWWTHSFCLRLRFVVVFVYLSMVCATVLLCEINVGIKTTRWLCSHQFNMYNKVNNAEVYSFLWSLHLSVIAMYSGLLYLVPECIACWIYQP